MCSSRIFMVIIDFVSKAFHFELAIALLSWRVVVVSLASAFFSSALLARFFWDYSFLSLKSLMYAKLGVSLPLDVITALLSSGRRSCSSIGAFLSLLTMFGIHFLSNLLKCIAKLEK